TPAEDRRRAWGRRRRLVFGLDLGRGLRRDAGIVHQDAEAPESTDRRRDQLADRLVSIEVTRDREDLHPRRVANLLRGLVEIARRPAAERDVHALLRQHLRTRPPQPLAGASDAGPLVPQLEVHGPSTFCYPP